MNDRAAKGGGVVSYPSTPYQVKIGYGNNKAGIVQNNGADWFGPLDPLNPTAPPEVAGRAWDFPSGYNLQTRARAYEPVTFWQLRSLADTYDLLRVVIETRKDQVSRYRWNITTRDEQTKIEGAVAKRVADVEAFFQYPDQENSWDDWIRMILEDLFVIDAVSIYRRKTRGGKLIALQQISGDTIKRVIGDDGRTPLAPAVAYQQILKGMPAIDYTTDDLIYAPRNKRPGRPYGFSPVEQILMTVNIGLRRQLTQLNWFDESNIPKGLVPMPEGWSNDQIRQFQDWFDSRLQGNLSSRSSLLMVPSSVGKGLSLLKEGELFGAAEDWLARLVCAAFSMAPTPFIKQMNRATANNAKEQAEEEGLQPLLTWIKGLVDRIIARDLGQPDLQFAWKDDSEEDPNAKMVILTGYAAKGALSLNEVRADLGRDAVNNEAFDTPMVLTPSGYVPITLDPPPQPMGFGATPPGMEGKPMIGPDGKPVMGPDGKPVLHPPAAPGGESGDGSGSDGDGDGKPGGADVSQSGRQVATEDADEQGEIEGQAAPHVSAQKIRKAAKKIPVTSLDRPKVQRHVAAVSKALKPILASSGMAAAIQVEKVLKRMGKAAGGDGDHNKVTAAQIAEGIDLSDLDDIQAAIEDDLSEVAADSAEEIIKEIGLDNADLVDQVSQRAVAWARDRGAQLVSLQGDQSLVAATRNQIANVIADGLDQNIGAKQIADMVQTSTSFSSDRSDLIARTEVGNANSQGALQGMKGARDIGVSIKKSWLASAGCCDDCQDNEDEGPIDLDEDFPSGDNAPLAHPNCGCVLVSEIGDDSAEGDNADE